MATITKFEDLEIWQLARELNKKLIPIIDKLNDIKNYDLKSQLDRSAGSVMDNISEGFERDGRREFIQFLSISKGSLGEVRSQLYQTLDREYLNQEDFDNLQKDCLMLASKLGKFISYLNKTEFKGSKFKTVN